MKTLLLTNDDGFYSKGITTLYTHLSKKFNVWIVAPDRERSAISMALTLNHPLRVNQIESQVFAVDGTTSDCVNIAIRKILPGLPDFVVSGMNMGENLSEDIFFSGTVAGAFSGYLYGIPAMAVSLISKNRKADQSRYQFLEGAKITERILERLIPFSRSPLIYNVNIPFDHLGEIRVTTMGSKTYQPDIIERTDPRGRKYFWIGTGAPRYYGAEGTDIWAVKNRFVSLSVVKYGFNSRNDVKKLEKIFKTKQKRQLKF